MMTYVTVNNKIFENLEDAREYERRVSIGWEKTAALRAHEARKRDLQEMIETFKRKLEGTCVAEELASADLDRALAAVREAAKKAIPYGLHLYGQRPSPQSREEQEV
jgi:cobalamin biosynthesis Mg chelatase CobN